MSKNLKRRNLSGIYIFYKFEDEDNRKPTCFEDCPEEKQDEWLNSLNKQALKNLSKQFANTLRDIGDRFGIVAGKIKEP